MTAFKKGDSILGKRDKYVLIDLIFPGDNVEIWKCDSASGQVLAIKLYLAQNLKSALKSPELVTKLGKIDSDCLLPIREAGLQEKTFFAVMEYCEKSLYDWIQIRGAESLAEKKHGNESRILFSKEEAVQITNDIFEGLNVLHVNSIVHLDVKPSNIMVREVNGRVVYALSDFDNIRDLEKTVSRSDLQKDHGISPYYAAPEQLLNDSYYGEPCSDIYSAGVALFEAFTGDRIPYPATKDLNDFRMRKGQVKYKLSQYNLDSPLVDTITQCMSIDKETRPNAADIYGYTKFYLDEKRWPGVNSNIGKSITTGGRTLTEAKPNTAFKYLWIGIIAFIGLGVFFGYKYLKKDLSSDNIQLNITNQCSDSFGLVKKDWANNIDKVKSKVGTMKNYGLRKSNDAKPFMCGYTKITKLTAKGFALVYQDSIGGVPGVIEKNGALFIPPNVGNKSVLEEYFEKNKDFRKLQTKQ